VTKIALIGFGTVGSSFAKALRLLSVDGLALTHIYNRGVARKRASAEAAYVGGDVVWTEDVEVLLGSDADVVVELIGGLDPAGGWRAARAW